MGCVVVHVYKLITPEKFKNGENVLKSDLKKNWALFRPYWYLKKYGPQVGIRDLPDDLFSREYCYPMVNEENVWDKIQCAESILQEHGIDITINLYMFLEDRVKNTLTTSEKSISVNRVTSSICMLGKSATNKPKNHNTSFAFMINRVGTGAKAVQFHCSLCLNPGDFVYFNKERFEGYDGNLEKLKHTINTTSDGLTGATFDGKNKVYREGTQNKRNGVSWQHVHICNACMVSFVRLYRFREHIKQCVGGHVSGMDFSTIPHVEHFEESEYPNTLLCPIVASFDTETCSNIDILRRVNKKGEVYISDQRKEAEMVLVAVVATVIYRPNKKLNYTIYKDLSMSDDELLDYESTVPWDIHRHVDVEDMANLSCSIDCFRADMDDFMDLKAKLLTIVEEKHDDDISAEDKVIIESELNQINEALMEKRMEVSRRFGVYFMELFQALMEATKKNVVVCQKKNLSLTTKQRVKPYSTLVETLDVKNVLDEKVDSWFVKRKVGFPTRRDNEAIGLDLTTSVRRHEKLNCKICNHKLDPIYIRHLQRHLNYRVEKEASSSSKDDAYVDNDDDDDDDHIIIVDGKAISIPSKKKTNNKKPMVNSDIQRDPNVPPSPHALIWSGRNAWQVKDRLYRFFCTILIRYKQEIKITEFRMMNDWLQKNPHNVIMPSEVKDLLRKQACEKVEKNFKIESSEEFVLSINASEWKFTEPYDSNEIEDLIECLYRFVELNVALDQLMKAFDSESCITSSTFPTIAEFVNQDTTKTYDRTRPTLTAEQLKEEEEMVTSSASKKYQTRKKRSNDNIVNFMVHRRTSLFGFG